MRINKTFISYLIVAILAFILLFILIKTYPIYKVVILFIIKVLAPFVIASFISYVLYPIIMTLESKKINRGLAILLIYISFFTLSGLLLYFGLPVFVNQLYELSEQIPQIISLGERFIYSIYESTSFLPELVHDKMDALLEGTEKAIEQSVERLLEAMTHIFDLILLLTVIPVLVFYFLKDDFKIKAYTKKVLKKHHFDQLALLINAVDESLGRYIRGQLLLSLTITFISYVIYHSLKLNYALLLAVFIGLFNVIPYFGPIIGIVPALLVAASMSWQKVVIVLIAALTIQILEGSVLSPYIIGKSVQIHPVVIILALIIGAEIGQIIGMVIAVPLLTIVKEVTTQLIAFKRSEN